MRCYIPTINARMKWMWFSHLYNAMNIYFSYKSCWTTYANKYQKAHKELLDLNKFYKYFTHYAMRGTQVRVMSLTTNEIDKCKLLTRPRQGLSVLEPLPRPLGHWNLFLRCLLTTNNNVPEIIEWKYLKQDCSPKAWSETTPQITLIEE